MNRGLGLTADSGGPGRELSKCGGTNVHASRAILRILDGSEGVGEDQEAQKARASHSAYA